ncbi:MAG TPA: PAS domain S-box protein [Bryobacteraceae bacterium]|nr:PAS domain S-box protein [Bryobacteraceae bacterium]
MPRQPVWADFAFVVVAVVAATALRLGLHPVLGPHLPFGPLAVAVIAVAAWRGHWPAIFATVLGTVSLAVFFVPADYSATAAGVRNWMSILFYLAVCITAIVLFDARRHVQEALLAESEQRRLAEAAAAQQRRWFEQTLASIGEAVIATDAQNRVAFLNGVAEGLTGWSAEEARGRKLTEVVRLERPETGAPGEATLLRRDDVRLEVEQNISPILAESGMESGTVLILRDTAERRRFERERDQAAGAARSVLESIGDGFFALDDEFRLTYVNREAERVTGLTREQMLGRSPWDVFPPVRGTLVEQQYRKCATERIPISFEYLHEPWKRWFEIRCHPGGAGGISVYIRDITGRKRNEEEISELNERLRFHLENTPLGIVEWDRDFRVISWNKGAERIFGWNADEMVGRKISEIKWIHEEDLPAVQRLMEGMISGGSPRNVNTNRNYTKEGGVAECEWYNSVLVDSAGHLKSVHSVVVDVTERNRTERALRDSESKLRTVFEAVSQGILAVDEEGRITAVNRRTEEIFGYTRDELTGSPLALLLPEHSIDTLRTDAGDHSGPPPAQLTSASLDVAARRRDGTGFPVEMSVRGVELQGRRLTVAVITDATERKRLEEQLRQTQKLESLGVLAGGIAHDFNNLLTGMMGNASLVLDEMPPGHPNRRALDGVIRAAESAAHLTRQLLAYAGKGQFTIGPVDLSGLVEEVAGLVRRSIPKNVQVELDLVRPLPAVQGDPGQMNQVVMNLIINAAESIGETRQGIVRVSTRVAEFGAEETPMGYDGSPLLPGRYVRLEVRDNGCGMDEVTKSRIFDPFFSTKFLGRGLGLAAVHGILRAHRGAINVKSEPGRGSTFTVLLPAAG